MMQGQLEMLQLKLQLAKERAQNESLSEELVMMKKVFSNEISLLQETIEIQRLV
jgi:hypothetical protein